MSTNATAPSADRSFIIATGNPGKRREFEHLLGDFLSDDWQVFDRTNFPEPLDEVVEDADTFHGNAVKKAVETSHQTGCCALADDSGLQVDALDGAPGVYSARFAGKNASDEENNRLLVSKLEGVPEDERTARFVCALALALPDNDVGQQILDIWSLSRSDIEQATPDQPGKPVMGDDRVVVWFRGEVEGRIVDDPTGDQGFGYDPHFFVPDRGKTMAQLSVEQKNQISHRARAVGHLLRWNR